jgi:hypothetical protein
MVDCSIVNFIVYLPRKKSLSILENPNIQVFEKKPKAEAVPASS